MKQKEGVLVKYWNFLENIHSCSDRCCSVYRKAELPTYQQQLPTHIHIYTHGKLHLDVIRIFLVRKKHDVNQRQGHLENTHITDDEACGMNGFSNMQLGS